MVKAAMLRVGVAACCLALATSALSDDSGLPLAGSRVRVRVVGGASRPVVGILTAANQKVLTLSSIGGAAPGVFARTELLSLERSVKPSRKKKGAALGFGLGFGVGFAGTFILCKAFGDSCPSGELLVFGSLYGAGVGVLGAGLGAAVAPGEQWESVPLTTAPSAARSPAPSSRARWAILPLVGQRRGVTFMVSF